MMTHAWVQLLLFPAPPTNLDGMRKQQSEWWTSRGNYASPEADLSLETNSASPEPGLGYLLPANPVGGHSFNCIVKLC
jgi:hypothetical protein